MHSSYLTESARLAYESYITTLYLENLVSDMTPLPPLITKKAGRPKTLRFGSRGETSTENQLYCNSYGQREHNKITCLRRIQTVVVTQSMENEQPSNLIVIQLPPAMELQNALEITQDEFDEIQNEHLVHTQNEYENDQLEKTSSE
jgi:hypothetical protein